MITKVYALDEDYSAKRATYEECVNFMVKDCDDAIKELTGKSTQKGKNFCFSCGFKVKGTLMSSDLHDSPTARSNLKELFRAICQSGISWVSTGDRMQRWKADRMQLKL
ncbi:hypothetical protein CS542_05830 [Pedobacter sp. IW39]|nr:hypothetical protein CS542_05830 [Pedobacter sp. IW39]